MGYTTVKLSRELKDRLEGYARSKGLTLSGAIDNLLEKEELRNEIKEIKELLREQNRLLGEILQEIRKLKVVSVEGGREVKEEVYKEVVEEVGGEMPSFVQDNPWVEVLVNRR